MRRIILAPLTLLCTLASSFITQPAPFLPQSSSLSSQTITTKFLSSSSLSMAGFGAGSSKKTIKLKPKTQWDRYLNLKKSSAFYVAARLVNEGDSGDSEEGGGDWFSVGAVRSEEDEFTEAAVGLQKGIIMEHAKRLYPLKFLPKSKVQFGYSSILDSTEYTLITDKSDTTSGIEKKIGFEGNADPSGYYGRTGSMGYDGVAGKKDRGFGSGRSGQS